MTGPAQGPDVPAQVPDVPAGRPSPDVITGIRHLTTVCKLYEARIATVRDEAVFFDLAAGTADTEDEMHDYAYAAAGALLRVSMMTQERDEIRGAILLLAQVRPDTVVRLRVGPVQ